MFARLPSLRRNIVVLTGLTALLLSPTGLNANPPGPTVTITQPAAGYATHAGPLEVTVAFEANAAPAGGRPTGNVQTVGSRDDLVEPHPAGD